MTELYFIRSRNTGEVLTSTLSEKYAKEIMHDWGNPEYLKVSKAKVDFKDIGHYEWVKDE